jgi:hypothetical protein
MRGGADGSTDDGANRSANNGADSSTYAPQL